MNFSAERTLAPLQAKLGSQLAGLKAEQAGVGVKVLAEDELGRLGGYFLDVHAAFAGDHQHRQRRGPIDDDAQVQLAGNVAALFDQHLVDLLASRTGLNCHQVVAQQGSGDFLGFGGAFDQFDPVLLGFFLDGALAASAGVDLCLDDRDRAAELRVGGSRFVGRARHDAARHGDMGVAKELLGLIFVDFHARREKR